VRVLVSLGVLVIVVLVGLLLVADLDEAIPPGEQGNGADPIEADPAEADPVEAEPVEAEPFAPAGVWTEIPCPVDAGEMDIAVTCGELTVPVRREAADGPTMALAVAVLHGQADPGFDDAILYLVGGPGGSAVAELEEWTYDPALETRDIVLLDQRGTGWSRPSLQCPESHVAEDHIEQLEAFERCRTRLVAEGVDLDAYRTADIAADVTDLRVALGYESWNLWGSSYGTRVALAVLRDDPSGVRSVVLEGAYPMDVDAYADTVDAGIAALEHLFARCEAEPSCAAAYPDLAVTFTDTVLALDQDPVVLADDDGTELDGIAFADAVISGLGQSHVIPLIPAWITAIAAGDDEPLEELIERTGYGHDTLDDSEPVFYLIECAEEVAHSALADIAPNEVPAVLGVDDADLPAVGQADVVAGTIAACEIWSPTPADPREDQPVHSEVPALVFAGTFDPATPPWWGERAVSTLTNATLLRLPTLGHDTIDAHWCPRELFDAFIDDPLASLDTSCIGDMEVDFALPGE
jgi:pimeloyl-ACP methyl ester carboxylesterase